MKPNVLYLTCASSEEADHIAKVLLEKRLIICAKRTAVTSQYLWKRKIEKAQEVLLIMDSIEENFENIEKEIKKLHSYKTFVLYSHPVKTTTAVNQWIKDELKSLR